MTSKTSKTYKSILVCYKEVLSGTLLCIDPSTGSKSSKPGYAIYVKGNLVESGEIDLDITMNKSKRLYEISRTLREEFDKPDVLAVEYIPMVTYRGARHSMNQAAIMGLQKSIGAILAAHPVDILLEIPASAWSKYKDEKYIKSDVADAEYIGKCVVSIARTILEECEGE